MEYTEPIDRTECIGNSLPKINSNFENLDEVVVETQGDLQDLTTTVQYISANNLPYDRPNQFKLESTFTYGANIWRGTAGLVNQWADLFVTPTPTRRPMRIAVSVPSEPKMALITARIHLRCVNNPTSSWVRLGLFDNLNGGDLPSEVLDIAGIEGIGDRTFGSPVNLQAVYILEPRKTYIFGVQTFFHRSARVSSSSSVIVNGWQMDDSTAEQLANTKDIGNLKDIQATNLYDTNPNTGTNRMGKNKKYGYTVPAQAIQKEIKNVSFIRAIIL